MTRPILCKKKGALICLYTVQLELSKYQEINTFDSFPSTRNNIYISTDCIVGPIY